MKLVLRLPVPSTPRSRYYAVSASLHVAGAVLLILAPLLRAAGPRITEDAALVVDVVGSLPAAKPAAPQAKVETPDPAATQPPPEGVRAEPEVPPEIKPEKKPEKKEPKPEVEPKPVETPPQPVPSGPEIAEHRGPVDTGVGAAPGGAAVESAELSAVENAWYRAAIHSALQSSWVRPIMEGRGETPEVIVAFDILRNGEAANPRVIMSSGLPGLDRSALRAVVDASPFPLYPEAWRKPFITATAVFTLETGRR